MIVRMDSIGVAQFSAVRESWKLTSIAMGLVDEQVASKSGTFALYDSTGSPCTVNVNANFAEDELDTAAKAAASKAVIVCWGTSDSAMMYLLKDKSYVALAKKINRELIGGYESSFRYIIASDFLLRSCKLPALPESGWRRIVATVSNSGFVSATAALGALLSFLITAVFSRAPGGWMSLGVSLVVMLMGFVVGGVGQFYYRRMVAESMAS
jgi:hypothetical protein